ncbi:MAG: hypothetical protein ACLP8Y_03355 [Thermoplasmata archaeon]
MTEDAEPTERQAHLATLRADRDIQAWLKDHRSTNTAEAQIVQLELFCRRTGASPAELVALGRAQRKSPEVRDRGLSQLVQKWVDSERKAGRPDSYIATNWAAVRSWLKFNEAAPQWAPKLKVRRGTTLGDETVPNPQELGRILSVLNSRDRVIALCMAHSGLRPGALGTRYETSGLRLRDLPDLDIRRLVFRAVPFRLVVPADLSKSGNEYLTFGSSEAAAAITGYLTERRHRKEVLGPDSALVRSEPKTSFNHRREFLSEKSIGTQLRKGMEKVCPKGRRWRAYVLRSYFSSQMESAERAGKTTRTFREAMMGHTTSIEFAYHLGKKLSPEKVEEMRAAYRRAEPFLLVAPGSSRAASNAEAHRVLLSAWYTDEEIGKVDLEDAAAVIEAIRKGAAKGSAATVPKQQLIPEADLPRYLAEGWVARMPVNGSQFVVERA